MKAIIMIATFFAGVALNAQVTTGTIHGKIFEEDGITTIIGVRVWVDTESGPVGAMSDFEGRYNISGLKPGLYNLHAKLSSFDTVTMAMVQVTPDGLTNVDFNMVRTLTEIEVLTYKEPLIVKDIVKVRILTEDIEHSPYIRDPKTLLTTMSSDVRMAEGTGQVIIRGSRPGDAVYYIDGVKATDLSALPGVAIGGMEAYTGGIPAKYGDTTGGVVILETKSYFDLYNAWLAGQ